MKQEFRSLDLAKQLYRCVRGLRLSRHLSDQLFRAATSVVCNLAEGRARPTTADQRRFFYMAYASAKECIAILELAEVGDLSLWDLADHTAASIYKLCQTLR